MYFCKNKIYYEKQNFIYYFNNKHYFTIRYKT